MVFLADTSTMNNSFSKEDRMCSDRKIGSWDRQQKNEAKQHGDVSSLLGLPCEASYLFLYKMLGTHS